MFRAKYEKIVINWGPAIMPDWFNTPVNPNDSTRNNRKVDIDIQELF